jgi:hypothetical protein
LWLLLPQAASVSIVTANEIGNRGFLRNIWGAPDILRRIHRLGIGSRFVKGVQRVISSITPTHWSIRI